MKAKRLRAPRIALKPFRTVHRWRMPDHGLAVVDVVVAPGHLEPDGEGWDVRRINGLSVAVKLSASPGARHLSPG
jgi:hypothetical protein